MWYYTVCFHLKKNELGLDVAKIQLLKVEQEILYQAVEAYTGLVLANKKYKINQSNINLLERQVETDQARLEKGQISVVDLAQSESSLAGANAKFIQAKNEVVTGKFIYENVIGSIDKLSDLNVKLRFPGSRRRPRGGFLHNYRIRICCQMLGTQSTRRAN